MHEQEWQTLISCFGMCWSEFSQDKFPHIIAPTVIVHVHEEYSVMRSLRRRVTSHAHPKSEDSERDYWDQQPMAKIWSSSRYDSGHAHVRTVFGRPCQFGISCGPFRCALGVAQGAMFFSPLLFRLSCYITTCESNIKVQACYVTRGWKGQVIFLVPPLEV
jgi:hypothetical protein